MKLRSRASLSTIVLLAAVQAGCQRLGSVNQGQVIEFDSASGMMLLIQNSNYLDQANPRFDVLPALKVRVPADKLEMGPTPEAGKLLALDLESKVLIVFDNASRGFKPVHFTLIGRHDNVYSDDPRVARERFPIVDLQKREITIHLPKQRRIVTISVPDEMFSLPPDSWRAGDEVRYYYKDPGQALRLMNITKTDFNKAGK